MIVLLVRHSDDGGMRSASAPQFAVQSIQKIPNFAFLPAREHCRTRANQFPLLDRKIDSTAQLIDNLFYTLSEAWSGVNCADLMAAQGAFRTDFYDRFILRPKHRAYYCSGWPVKKIGPKGALGSHEIRPIHSAPSLGQSIWRLAPPIKDAVWGIRLKWTRSLAINVMKKHDDVIKSALISKVISTQVRMLWLQFPRILRKRSNDMVPRACNHSLLSIHHSGGQHTYYIGMWSSGYGLVTFFGIKQ